VSASEASCSRARPRGRARFAQSGLVVIPVCAKCRRREGSSCSLGRAGRRGGRTRPNGGTRPAARDPRPVCPCTEGPCRRPRGLTAPRVPRVRRGPRPAALSLGRPSGPACAQGGCTASLPAWGQAIGAPVSGVLGRMHPPAPLSNAPPSFQVRVNHLRSFVLVGYTLGRMGDTRWPGREPSRASRRR
jgi:hypothetical protein